VVIPKPAIGGVPGDRRRDLEAFKPWLATPKPEQIIDLDDNTNSTHLDRLVEVSGSRVRLIDDGMGSGFRSGGAPPERPR